MESQKSCRQCVSFQSTGFSLISAENLKKLDHYKSSRFYKKGEPLTQQGTPASHVYCLRSGLVKVETVSHEGSNMIVGYLKGGDLLGLGAVLSGDYSYATAVAVEETYACSFSAEFLRAILHDSPDLAMRYMTQLMNDLRQTQQRLMSGVEKDVSARVAEALIYLKTNFSEHKFTRKEIAEWAGTTTESVIRALGQFEDSALIAQEGRAISVLDKAALMRLAGIYI